MLAFGATVDKLVVRDVSVLYRHLAERGLGFFVLEIYIFIIWGGLKLILQWLGVLNGFMNCCCKYGNVAIMSF